MDFSTCNGTVTIREKKHTETYTMEKLIQEYEKEPLWKFACALNVLYMSLGDDRWVEYGRIEDSK